MSQFFKNHRGGDCVRMLFVICVLPPCTVLRSNSQYVCGQVITLSANVPSQSIPIRPILIQEKGVISQKSTEVHNEWSLC